MNLLKGALTRVTRGEHVASGDTARNKNGFGLGKDAISAHNSLLDLIYFEIHFILAIYGGYVIIKFDPSEISVGLELMGIDNPKSMLVKEPIDAPKLNESR